MAFGTKGEMVSHVGAITMRVLGDGVLDMELNTLQDVRTKALIGFQMQATTEIQPTRLTNFKTQRFRLHGFVDAIDEYFIISTIILWIKPVASSLPSNKNAIPTT